MNKDEEKLPEEPIDWYEMFPDGYIGEGITVDDMIRMEEKEQERRKQEENG